MGQNETMQPAPSVQPRKFCQHCGAEIPADAVVCTHCGRQVSEISQQPPR